MPRFFFRHFDAAIRRDERRCRAGAQMKMAVDSDDYRCRFDAMSCGAPLRRTRERDAARYGRDDSAPRVFAPRHDERCCRQRQACQRSGAMFTQRYASAMRRARCL